MPFYIPTLHLIFACKKQRCLLMVGSLHYEVIFLRPYHVLPFVFNDKMICLLGREAISEGSRIFCKFLLVASAFILHSDVNSTTSFYYEELLYV